MALPRRAPFSHCFRTGPQREQGERTDLRSEIFFICYHQVLFEVDFDAGCGGSFRVASDAARACSFRHADSDGVSPNHEAASFPMEI